MMVVGLNTKKLCTGKDNITYLTPTLKVKIIVTSFLYATLGHALIHTHDKKGLHRTRL